MAKFIFLKNFDWTSPPPECSKSNPPCSYMPMRRSFKKGDTIEGNIVVNTINSEPPTFLESGDMRIGFGGTASQIIQQVSTTSNAIPIGKDNRQNDNTKSDNNNKKTMFNTKNIVILILIIVGLIVFLKWKKII